MKDTITLNKKEFVKNMTDYTRQVLGRRQLGTLGELYGGDRDTYQILGYKQSVCFEDYYKLWRREGLGTAVIRRPVSSTWRKDPQIYTELESDSFETELEKLDHRVNLFSNLRTSDLLSGIGQYGGLFLGFKEQDFQGFDKPAQPIKGVDGLAYVRPLMESDLSVSEYNKDKNSPRFGRPEYLSIKFSYGNETESKTKVHWSRVLWFAEDTEGDPLLGKPRLESVINRMWDLQKVVGGSAESFWSLADAGYKILANKDRKPEDNVEVDWESIEDDFKAFSHKFIKMFGLDGVDEVEKMESTPPDPTGVFKVIIEYIAASVNPPIPMRILIGSERGELASTTDLDNWYAGIADRQKNYVNPIILRQTIDRFMEVGILDKADYKINWPTLYEKDEKTKSETAYNQTRAIKAYNEAMALGDPVISPEELRETMGYTPEIEPQLTKNQRKIIKKHLK